MNCLYLTSIEIDGKSAASNHVSDMVNGFLENGVYVKLVSASSKLRSVCFKRDSIKLWFPRFRGGWWIFQFQFLVFCILASYRNYNFIYFRLSSSRFISFALGFFRADKFMELNGLEIINESNFVSLLNSSDKVFVSTELSRSILSEAYPEKEKDILVNSNVGVSPNRFSDKNKKDCRKKLGLEDKELIFVLVSGFQEHHDFDTVLQAFLLFNRESPSSRLILVGDGPRKKEIEIKVKDLFSNGEIYLTGSLYIEDVADYVGAADLCLNIMYEWKLKHHGNINAQKTYEYMAVGRPVIETCIANNFIPSWAHEKLIIINPESVEELYKAFNLVFNDYGFYKNKAFSNQLFIKNECCWSKIAANVVNQLKTSQ